jgi:predicted DNA-binding protein (UPF0251 family)
MPVPRARHFLQICKDYYRRMFAVNNSTEPQVLTCIPIVVTGAETADVDIVMETKFEVIRVDCLKRNGAGAANTMQVKRGSTAISNAIACAVDNTLTSSGTIDDAQSTLAEGETLKLTATYAAGTLDALVLVYGFIRA